MWNYPGGTNLPVTKRLTSIRYRIQNLSRSCNTLLFFRNSPAIDLLDLAHTLLRDGYIVPAVSVFEKLPKLETELEKLTVDNKLVQVKKRLHILILSDKIMIILNKIPWESITLRTFKYWCDILFFVNTLYGIVEEDNSSKNVLNLAKSVDLKVFRFFFRGLIHFRKMNIEIVDANINSVVSRKENFLMRVNKRIKNCETIRDLIDSSQNAECPVCKDVTFTESTDFVIKISCNHLVCLSCSDLLVEFNHRLVKNIYIFFFWLARYFCFRYFIILIHFYWIQAGVDDLHIVRLDSFAWSISFVLNNFAPML